MLWQTLVVGVLVVWRGLRRFGPDGASRLSELGYRAPATMALLAGAAEVGGGALLAIGFLTPFAALAQNYSIATGGTGGVYYPLGGGMAAVRCEPARVASRIAAYPDSVSIAAINGPADVVISMLRQYEAAGVTDVCIRFSGEDQREQLARFSREVLPAFR